MIDYKFGVLSLEISSNLTKHKSYSEINAVIMHVDLYHRLRAECENTCMSHWSFNAKWGENTGTFYDKDIIITLNNEYENKYSFVEIK